MITSLKTKGSDINLGVNPYIDEAIYFLSQHQTYKEFDSNHFEKNEFISLNISNFTYFYYLDINLNSNVEFSELNKIFRLIILPNNFEYLINTYSDFRIIFDNQSFQINTLDNIFFSNGNQMKIINPNSYLKENLNIDRNNHELLSYFENITGENQNHDFIKNFSLFEDIFLINELNSKIDSFILLNQEIISNSEVNVTWNSFAIKGVILLNFYKENIFINQYTSIHSFIRNPMNIFDTDDYFDFFHFYFYYDYGIRLNFNQDYFDIFTRQTQLLIISFIFLIIGFFQINSKINTYYYTKNYTLIKFLILKGNYNSKMEKNKKNYFKESYLFKPILIQFGLGIFLQFGQISYYGHLNNLNLNQNIYFAILLFPILVLAEFISFFNLNAIYDVESVKLEKVIKGYSTINDELFQKKKIKLEIKILLFIGYIFLMIIFVKLESSWFSGYENNLTNEKKNILQIIRIMYYSLIGIGLFELLKEYINFGIKKGLFFLFWIKNNKEIRKLKFNLLVKKIPTKENRSLLTTFYLLFPLTLLQVISYGKNSSYMVFDLIKSQLWILLIFGMLLFILNSINQYKQEYKNQKDIIIKYFSLRGENTKKSNDFIQLAWIFSWVFQIFLLIIISILISKI